MATGSDVRAGRAFVELYVRNTKLMRGLANAQRRLRAFGDATMMVGRQISMASGVIIAGFGLATKTFIGFQDQMKTVQAVTRATTDEFQRLYDLAKKLGRTTSFTAAQVAGAEVSLGRAGFKPAEIEASTKATLDLARATGTELPRAAEIAAGTLRAFNLEADQMTRVADVMVATANNSAQTLEELGESMKYAAPVAEEFGMSLEQTSKALGVMANMQIKGSMAGTSLRMILLQVSDPAIAKRIGDIAGQEAVAALQAGRLGDAMALIGKAMKGMSAMERIALGKELFGARAVSGALKLAKTDFPALSKAIDNAGGAAKRTAEIMDSGLGGAMRMLWSAVEGVQIAIGEALSGAFSAIAKIMLPVLGAFTKFIEQHKTMVLSTVAVIASVGGLGAGLIGIGISAKIAAFGLGFFQSVVLATAGILTASISPALAIGVALAAVGAGLLYLARNTAPVQAVGNAIAGYANAIGKMVSTVVADATTAWGGIRDAIAAGDMERAMKIITATLTLEWTRVTTGFTEAWNNFVSAFSVDNLALIWVELTHNIRVMWVDLLNFLNKTWAEWAGGSWVQTIADRLILAVGLIKGMTDKEIAKWQAETHEVMKQRRSPKRISAIDAKADRQKAAIEESRRKHEEAIGIPGMDPARAAKIAAAQKALDQAIKERDAAVAEAAKKRGQVAAGGGGVTAPAFAGVPGLDAAALSAAKTAIAGTFSASAVSGLGTGGNLQQRIAKAVEGVFKFSGEQTTLTKQLVTEVKRKNQEMAT